MLIYPSYYEYIVMSRLAYQHENSPPDKINNIRYLEDLGWSLHGMFPGSQASGYIGIIFVHERRKQCVLAHAGTLPERFSTLRADANGIVRGQPDPLIMDAILLPKRQREQVTALLSEGYYLSFTGHSLGGFLAEMSVYACLRGWGLTNAWVGAVTFDSPGSIEVMELWQSDIPGERIDLSNLNVVSFLSSPNLVNTCHQHPGTVYRLLLTIEENKTKGHVGYQGFANYLLDSHDLLAMMALFDAETGLPRPNTCIAMKNWPLADYEELFALKDSPVSRTLNLVIQQSVQAVWSIMSVAINRIQGKARERHSIVTLFGGNGINKLEQFLQSQANYHPQFDATTKEGLTAIIGTGYEVQPISYPLDQALSIWHFPKELLKFAVLHAANKDLAFYQDYLIDNDLSSIADGISSFKIDAHKIIVSESDSIFMLRNQWLTVWHRKKEIINNFKESYEAEKIEQLADNKEKLETCEAEIEKFRIRLKNAETTQTKATERYQQSIKKLELDKKELEQRIKILEEASQSNLELSIINLLGSVTTVPGATAITENDGISASDFVDIIKAAPILNNHGIYNVGGSVAVASGSTSKTVNRFAGASRNNNFSNSIKDAQNTVSDTLRNSIVSQQLNESIFFASSVAVGSNSTANTTNNLTDGATSQNSVSNLSTCTKK